MLVHSQEQSVKLGMIHSYKAKKNYCKLYMQNKAAQVIDYLKRHKKNTPG